MTALKIIYSANVIVAGWISVISLFYPRTAQLTIFSNTFAYSEAIRLVGALWGAVFILSALGLWFPQKTQVVLLFQLIYKSLWLLFTAFPAITNKLPYPKGMALFFLIWVIVLPFIINWKFLFDE